jgi:hypothetical protein
VRRLAMPCCGHAAVLLCCCAADLTSGHGPLSAAMLTMLAMLCMIP